MKGKTRVCLERSVERSVWSASWLYIRIHSMCLCESIHQFTIKKPYDRLLICFEHELTNVDSLIWFLFFTHFTHISTRNCTWPISSLHFIWACEKCFGFGIQIKYINIWNDVIGESSSKFRKWKLFKFDSDLFL